MGKRRDELLERAGSLPVFRHEAEQGPLALKAQGARVYDVDNVGYIDYRAGGGSVVVGYANQFVLDAVRKVLALGLPEGFHVPLEVELAESLRGALPWVRGWWFCRSSDDAISALVAWARQSTGKECVLVIDGGAPLPPVCGDGDAVRRVPAWDEDRIVAAIAGGASKIAAVVIDPVCSRAGVIQPPAGVLARIAEACRQYGVLFVLDERVSGFRLHRGGAAVVGGITPDVAVYGSALGGGFPIGAVAFEGATPMPTANPIAGPHPTSLAAAEAVVSILKNDSIYERLEGRCAQLVDGFLALAERFSRAIRINRMGSMFALYTTRSPVDSLAAAQSVDADAYRRLITALVDEGVLLPANPGATAFVSSAHGGKDIEETLADCERVLMRLHQEDLP